AKVFPDLRAAQRALCPPYREVKPDPSARATYDRLYAMWRDLYFAMGTPGSAPVAMGGVLPALREIAASAREPASGSEGMTCR
ncbi:MAG: hypothetical protein KGO03_10690, partial [Gemmatimonadota bacterium]|nr:hypothetical protein [Gemmatimonadota bacterium]